VYYLRERERERERREREGERRCEDLKIICVGMKMRRCKDVQQTPTIRRTLRSDALGKNP
jgi:hypothetical protein